MRFDELWDSTIKPAERHRLRLGGKPTWVWVDHLRASRSAEAQYMSGWTSLLTAGDLEELREALRRGWVTSLEWEAPALRLRVRVSTQRAASVWSVPMLVRLERWTPGQYSTQLFDSVEAMLDGY